MSVGYRLIIAVLSGLLFFIAFGLGLYVSVLRYPELEGYQSYGNVREDKSGLPVSTEAASIAQRRRPCENPESRDESELCAQWRAAEAAEESAIWARFGFFGGLFGLFGLWWQVVLTRRAVEETAEGYNIMRKANDIAELNQRPWISCAISVDRPVASAMFFAGDFVVTVKNIGQVPAKIVLVNCELYGCQGFPEQREMEMLCAVEASIDSIGTAILPGQHRQFTFDKVFYAQTDAYGNPVSPTHERARFSIGFNCRYTWAGGTGQTARFYMIKQSSAPNSGWFPIEFQDPPYAPEIFFEEGLWEMTL